jgi:hypothetical protein
MLSTAFDAQMAVVRTRATAQGAAKAQTKAEYVVEAQRKAPHAATKRKRNAARA